MAPRKGNGHDEKPPTTLGRRKSRDAPTGPPAKRIKLAKLNERALAELTLAKGIFDGLGSETASAEKADAVRKLQTFDPFYVVLAVTDWVYCPGTYQAQPRHVREENNKNIKVLHTIRRFNGDTAGVVEIEEMLDKLSRIKLPTGTTTDNERRDLSAQSRCGDNKQVLEEKMQGRVPCDDERADLIGVDLETSISKESTSETLQGDDDGDDYAVLVSSFEIKAAEAAKWSFWIDRPSTVKETAWDAVIRYRTALGMSGALRDDEVLRVTASQIMCSCMDDLIRLSVIHIEQPGHLAVMQPDLLQLWAVLFAMHKEPDPAQNSGIVRARSQVLLKEK